jgi:hypothetical protein
VPVIRLVPGNEPLHARLAREVDSAARHGQVVLVDVGSKGCKVCHIFHNALTDPVMVAALKDVRLIEMDYDDWSFRATTDGFEFSGALPILFIATSEGREGAIFNHNAWAKQRTALGADATAAQWMAPPLQTFIKHVRDSTAKANPPATQ